METRKEGAIAIPPSSLNFWAARRKIFKILGMKCTFLLMRHVSVNDHETEFKALGDKMRIGHSHKLA